MACKIGGSGVAMVVLALAICGSSTVVDAVDAGFHFFLSPIIALESAIRGSSSDVDRYSYLVPAHVASISEQRQKLLSSPCFQTQIASLEFSETDVFVVFQSGELKSLGCVDFFMLSIDGNTHFHNVSAQGESRLKASKTKSEIHLFRFKNGASTILESLMAVLESGAESMAKQVTDNEDFASSPLAPACNRYAWQNGWWMNVFGQISSGSDEFTTHYIPWRQARTTGIRLWLGEDFFVGKSVHELGCGAAHFSEWALQLGAKSVVASDARLEYVERVREMCPHFEVKLVDCDGPLKIDKVDFLIHFGLLYHLDHVEEHLLSLGNVTDYMLLETICSAKDDYSIDKITEGGYDQAVHNVGSRPTQSYVEGHLDRAGFDCERYDDPILNVEKWHYYDWEVQKHEWEFLTSPRRFWICWKKELPNPILR